MVTVALSQLNIQSSDLKGNLDRVRAHIQSAAQLKADMIILPELWNTGYDCAHFDQTAQSLRGKCISALKKWAREYEIFIFGGTIPEKKDQKVYNTCAAIDQKGEVVGKYRKIHLFPGGLQEDRYFAPGEEWGLIETPWGMAGIVICYDLRFPELVRNLVLRGAQFIVVPAQWPVERMEHWSILCQSRALDNQVFVLGVNPAGKNESHRYAGHSLIVSPWGEILKEGSEDEELVVLEIDLQEVDRIRKIMPVLQDRRNILDEIDNSLF
ncbi:carbon-nitrogen family hydrolase [Dehalobacterium formicoaceticum]|uniref:carbon-nitrogen family hydrolase n=1 Tax=Dehalobacterium formicoaceticum TaxID=51515 RepID=UPI0031F6048D